MYIGDVIERVKNYFPSEYDEKEMYLWCDEVSSMLCIEDRNIFSVTECVPDDGGCILLPDGVKFENIISVESGNKVLKKTDMRFCGDTVEILDRGAKVRIVYLEPYRPIRQVEYNGQIKIRDGKLYLGKNEFIPGDIINTTADGVARDINVLETGTDTDDDLGYYIVTGENGLDGMQDGEDIHIKRVITDKTVCDAPYDGMYVDYILAKIGMYQRDFNSYNQFMTMFNSRLDAYKRWLTNYMPQSGGKFKNWW